MAWVRRSMTAKIAPPHRSTRGRKQKYRWRRRRRPTATATYPTADKGLRSTPKPAIPSPPAVWRATTRSFSRSENEGRRRARAGTRGGFGGDDLFGRGHRCDPGWRRWGHPMRPPKWATTRSLVEIRVRCVIPIQIFATFDLSPLKCLLTQTRSNVKVAGYMEREKKKAVETDRL